MPHLLDEKLFSIALPDSFEIHRDGERLQCVSREPVGVLSLTPEEVENADELPNLSRMLAGFLTRSGHPVATDELLRVSSVSGAHGFSWQYTEDSKYHRLWLFGNKFCWLLVTFICPQDGVNEFHERLQELVKTIRLKDGNPD
ncbi:MAG TPA: hypothetical protein EYO33_28860 [Phycisphaerales bacterium]|nr:hypothetical protein [Phycisphaerales bacterium]